MFDVAWSELLLVAIVAILVVGPKELPALLRSLGSALGKLRRQADEFRKHFDDAVREAGAEDLQREMRALRQNNPLTQIRDSIEDAARDPSTPKPETPPAISAADDDLGPPPPLPPRPGGSYKASGPVAGEAQAPAASGADNAAAPEPRLNGEHRPAS
jgi:sec-independent protein translocase protein TatB